MRLLLATTNRDKVREVRYLLADVPVEIRSLGDFPPVDEPEETGDTFQANARLKAIYYDEKCRVQKDPAYDEAVGRVLSDPPDPSDAPDLTVAEDSGLVVDALDGEPGVRSARFLRPDASYRERFDEILRRLEAHPERPRTARFVCALAVVRQGKVVFEAIGSVEGAIATEPRGSGGFGYDPLFYFPAYGRTLAEVSEAEKLVVAHRGEAFRALARWLAKV